MAKKPTKKTSKTKAAAGGVESYPCTFGGISRGKHRARIKVTFANRTMTTKEAERFFINSQLQVGMESDPEAGNDGKGQGKLIETGTASMNGTAECRKFDHGDDISASLSFAVSAVDAPAFWALACQPGTITMTRSGDAQERRGRPSADRQEDDETDDLPFGDEDDIEDQIEDAKE